MRPIQQWRAPKFDGAFSSVDLRNRHQVIDLIAPFAKGGKVSLFWWRQCGKRQHDGSSLISAKHAVATRVCRASVVTREV